MAVPASQSSANLRQLLLTAMGFSWMAGCSDGKVDAANDQTDITDVTPGTDDTATEEPGPESRLCPDAVPILDAAGEASGFVECGDGAVLRIADHDWPEVGQCASDADCAAGEACVADSIAGMGSAGTVCIPASCQTGDDCDSGECGLSTYDDGCGVQATLVCRTDADACRSDADCMPETDQCVVTYWSEEAWVCAGMECAIGRPLMGGADGKTPVLGPVLASEARGASEVACDPQKRRVLADWWAHVAQMEHASVASFARFTLELMSLGAPPALLLEVQAAAADEVRHASDAFGLASRFAGRALSPGPLPVEGLVPRPGPEAILRALVTEACVGETVGVAEARLALAGTKDSQTRSVLKRIVEDETRHAALAWKTLAWMLESTPSLAPVARLAFAEAQADLRLATLPECLPILDYGLLDNQQRRQVRLETLARVVGPCAEQVLARCTGSQSPRGCVTEASPIAGPVV